METQSGAEAKLVASPKLSRAVPSSVSSKAAVIGATEPSGIRSSSKVSSPPIVRPEPAPRVTDTSSTKNTEQQVAMPKAGALIGTVRKVNREHKFIVIEFDIEKPLPVGTTVWVWRAGNQIAKAQIDEPPQHWPVVTATILEGMPDPEDAITQ